MSPVGSQLFADGTYTLPEGDAQAVRRAAPTQRHASSFTSFRLDVFIVRKLGVPGHSELAMGAIASGGVRVLNDRVVEALGISDATVRKHLENVFLRLGVQSRTEALARVRAFLDAA